MNSVSQTTVYCGIHSVCSCIPH